MKRQEKSISELLDDTEAQLEEIRRRVEEDLGYIRKGGEDDIL